MADREAVFEGRSALVVGGSGGIGRAVAVGLAERGARVCIHGGHSAGRLERTLAELRKAEAPDSAASGFLYNIEASSPEEAAQFILAKMDQTPDILVLAWGPFARNASLAETTAKEWRFMTEFNLIFPEVLVSLAIRDMLRRGWGRILLFGGTKTSEISGFSTTVAYSAAKTALGVLVKSAARASCWGVTCNLICPGLVDTEYSTSAERLYNSRSPGGALDCGAVARAALAVLENEAVNGSLIPVDGGL
ncbi:MAG: SDR family NAD(P)-dependent oxidoreductase [Treponema sp.]|jgi:3-oxoacyl-[acyl-carrier protein] reductase|nr:SDR family NAD(P)-dependent oxidoreductase [Treponema sp.]